MENKFCQSCGMPLNNPDWLGTSEDKSRNEDFCHYCIKNGELLSGLSMDEIIDIWIKHSDDFNRYADSNLSKEEIGALLRKRLPHLKRWNQKNETNEAYHASFNQVTNYINEHLFETLALKKLAQIANLSEFHFHRIFRALSNENIGEYIQRLRLEFVAHKLLSTNQTLTQIAEQTSYKNIYTLSKAFKKHFGVSPSNYKKAPRYAYTYKKSYEGNVSLSPETRKIKQQNIIYLNIHDAYQKSSTYEKVWSELLNYIKNNNLENEKSKYISISFDDQIITPFKQCRFYIGMTIQKEIKPSGKFGIMSIPKGEYAVFKYKGKYSDLHTLYHDIYLNWLPQSGYQLRNTFSFEMYLNTPREVSQEKLLTEIYIPIEKVL